MTKRSTSLQSIHTPIFSKKEALFRALFDVGLYLDVFRRWKGIGLSYLFLLMCIIAVPVSMLSMKRFHDYFFDNLIYSIQSIPTITLQNGFLSIEEKNPYFIKSPNNDLTVVIDTSKSLKQLKHSYPSAMLLLNKNGFVFQSGGQRTMFLNSLTPMNVIPPYEALFDKKMNAIFDGHMWLSSVHYMYYYVIGLFLIYPSVVCSLFAVYTVLLLTIGVLGQVIASTILRFSMGYAATLRLMMVSSTLHLYCLAFFMAMQYYPSYMGAALMMMLFFYFCVAVIMIKKYSKQLVHT